MNPPPHPNPLPRGGEGVRFGDEEVPGFEVQGEGEWSADDLKYRTTEWVQGFKAGMFLEKLTLTLSPPIGCERRGNSQRTAIVV